MALTRIDVLVMFNEGSATVWNDVNVPVPNGAFILDDVNKTIKKGDGVTLFASLPVVLDYGFADDVSPAVIPENADEGMMAYADGGAYTPSTTVLSDVLNSILDLQTKEGTQNTRYTALETGRKIDDVIAGDEGMIVMCSGGIYSPSTLTIAQLLADVIANVSAGKGKPHMKELTWYTDKGLTHPLGDDEVLHDRSKFFCEVDVFHDNVDIEHVDFGMTCTHPEVTIRDSKEYVSANIMQTLAGTTGEESFHKCAVDSSGNVYAGYSATTGNIIVVKMDADLNVLARQSIGGSGVELFNNITIDNGNVFIVGSSTSSTSGKNYAAIYKLSAALALLGYNLLGDASYDSYFYSVCIDTDGSVYAIGKTTYAPNGGTHDILIAKLDNNLSGVISKKAIGDTGTNYGYDICINKIADDISSIVACGYTAGTSVAWVMTLDTSLNLDKIVTYNNTLLFGIVTYQGMIYAVGDDVAATPYPIIIKLNSELELLGQKNLSDTYGTAGSGDKFRHITVNEGTLLCIGFFGYGTGNSRGLICSFDTELKLLDSKIINGTGDDPFYGIAVTNDALFACGYTTTSGSGGSEAVIYKLDLPLPEYQCLSSDGLYQYDDVAITETTLTGSVADASATMLSVNSLNTTATATFTAAPDTSSTVTTSMLSSAHAPSNATNLLSNIFYGAETDVFEAMVTDAAGNAICVGHTTSEGTIQAALVVKFDSEMVVVSRKKMDTADANAFLDVKLTSTEKIVCVGSNTGVDVDAVLVILNTDFTISSQTVYSSANVDVFYAVAIDTNDNMYCVGSYGDLAIIVQYTPALTIAAQETYGGNGSTLAKFTDLEIDSAGNVICVGSVYVALDTKYYGVVVKYNSALTIVAHKVFGSLDNALRGVALDSTGNVFVSGYAHDGVSRNGLLIKMDAALTVLADIVYGSNLTAPVPAYNVDEFFDVVIDPVTDEVVVGGITNSEGASGGGAYDLMFVRFSNDLTDKLGGKTYGTVASEDAPNRISIVNGRLYVASSTIVPQSANPSAIAVNMDAALEKGTYPNTRINTLVMSDSRLPMGDSTLNATNSSYVATTATVTPTAGTLAISNSIGGTVPSNTLINPVSNVFEVSIDNVVAATGNPSGVIERVMNVDSVQHIAYAMAEDASGNIYVGGGYGAGSAGNYHPYIAKMDANLNIVSHFTIDAGTTDGNIVGIVIDSNGDIICVGFMTSKAFVVKLNSTLTVIAQKTYDGANWEQFLDVTVDSSDNIICVGETQSEGTNSGTGINACLIVKFDSTLTILSRKVLSTTLSERIWGVAVDSLDNIYCVGDQSGSGILMSFDSSLVLQESRKLGLSGSVALLYDLVIDSSDMLYACGYTNAGVSVNTGLIMKLNTSLEVIDIYTANSYVSVSVFEAIALDSTGNVFVVGYSIYDETAGSVVKLDSNLKHLATNIFSTIITTIAHRVSVNAAGRVILASDRRTDANLYSSVVTVMNNGLVEGKFSNTTDLEDSLQSYSTQMVKSNLELTEAVFTVANSTLTLATSTETIAAATFVPAPVTTYAGFEEPTTSKLAMFDDVGSDTYRDIVEDSSGNFYACGYSNDPVSGYSRGIVTKFDSDMNIEKSILTDEWYYSGIVINSSDEIFVCGYYLDPTTSLYTGNVVKIDTSLAILGSKLLSGNGSYHVLTWNIAIDSSDNIYVIGNEYTVNGSSALIIKLTSSLVVDAKKYYGTTSVFKDVCFDSNDNVYAIGHTTSEGQGGYDILVVKFDSSLNIIARKIYGGTSAEYGYGCCIDINGDLVVTGRTDSENVPGSNATSSILMLKFNASLTLLNKMTYSIPGAIYGWRCSGLADGKIQVSVIYGNILILNSDLTYSHSIVSNIQSINLLQSSTGDTIIVGNLTIDSAVAVAVDTLNVGDILRASNGAMTISKEVLDIQSMVSGLTLADSTLTLATATVVIADYTPRLFSETSLQVTGGTDIIGKMFIDADSVSTYSGVAVDSSGNIYCVGSINSTPSPIIVKYDSDLNMTACVENTNIIGYFRYIIFDSIGNIICVGRTSSEGQGSNDALVVKFDSSLTILVRKIYGGIGDDIFHSVVVDSIGNIICVGRTNSEGQGSNDALVVKFDSSLNILVRKIYGGIGDDIFYDIVIDSNDNIICVGYTTSEGQGGYEALVVKFDNSLNILARKIYGDTTANYFVGSAIDNLDNIYCIGTNNTSVMLVKFDINLAIVTSVTCSAGNILSTNNMAIDSNGNIIFVGYMAFNSVNVPCVVIFNSSMIHQSTHVLTTNISGGNVAYDISVDANDNIICVGGIAHYGASIDQAFLLRLPAGIDAADSAYDAITLSNVRSDVMGMPEVAFAATSGLTLANSALTLATSALTLAASTITLTPKAADFPFTSVNLLQQDFVTTSTSKLMKQVKGSTFTASPQDFIVSANDGNNPPTVKTFTKTIDSEVGLLAVYSGIANTVFKDTTVDSAGNIICVGRSEAEGIGGGSSTIIKYDSRMNVLANKSLSGTSSSDIFYGVTVDTTDNIYCVGRSNDLVIMLKLSVDLEKLWCQEFQNDVLSGFTHVAMMNNGNIVAVGYDIYSSFYNIIAVSFTSAGTIVNSIEFGGTSHDIAYALAIDEDNNVYIGGQTSSFGQSSGLYNPILVKLNSSLVLVKSVTYSESGIGGGSTIESFSIDNHGDIIAIGTTNDSSGVYKAFIVKFDTDLNLLKSVAIDYNGETRGHDLIVLKNGNIVFVGSIDSEDGVVAILDESLDVIRMNRIRNSTSVLNLFGVTCDNIGNIICSGSTQIEGAAAIGGITFNISDELPQGIFNGNNISGISVESTDLETVAKVLVLETVTGSSSVTAYTTLNSTATFTDSNLTPTIDRIG